MGADRARPPGSAARRAEPEADEDVTEAELARRLEDMAAGDVLGVLESLASALFPAGPARMTQVSWEATPTPPAMPTTAREAPPGSAPDSDAEALLPSAEVRYRTLIDQIPAVTFMAALGEGENEVYVSPYIEALLGFTQKEWLSNPILWYRQLHPEDRAILVEEFARGCRTGGPFRAECRLLARDGHVVWVRGEARLIKDSLGRPLFLQGVGFDISESKRTQERALRQAVHRTQERYRDLVELLGAVFWEADARSGAFSFVSRGAERILGYPAERWTEDPGFWIGLVHPEDRERVARSWRQALDARRDGELEFRAISADGKVVWLYNSIHFPPAEEGDPRPLGVILDVTERRRWEKELADALAAAERARSAAETANRLKDEFLATMSHELRTPVNAVLGWSRILESGAGDPPTRKRALSAIRNNARAQTQLIADLLDVSRVVTGKLRLNIERVPLGSLIEETLDTVGLAAEAREIDLRTRLLDPDAVVRGDPDRLRQVISNLLANAVKFTEAGGRVEVRLETAGRRARVVVSDTGEGIDAAFLPYVFDRFRQSDGSTTRPHGGLGLGLAIVRHLVELHGGRVSAESEGKGRGATFTVELPLAKVKGAGSRHHAPERDHRPAEAHPPEESARGPLPDLLHGTRVLVVDDDDDSLDIMATGLSQAGAAVTRSSSAAEALGALHRHRFDLLVCDLAMPGMSGLDLIREVRAGGGPNQDVPAAALTALAGDENRDRALAAGFQSHLAKPIEMQHALASLARLLPD